MISLLCLLTGFIAAILWHLFRNQITIMKHFGIKPWYIKDKKEETK